MELFFRILLLLLSSSEGDSKVAGSLVHLLLCIEILNYVFAAGASWAESERYTLASFLVYLEH